jgi:hypothetical protein
MDRRDFTSMLKPMAIGIGVSIIMMLIAASILFA